VTHLVFSPDAAVNAPSRSVRLPPAICLMGPTASGKTAFAVELVKRLPLEIVSVDSAMVYRGMNIGTGKPGVEVLSIAPHHLIDFLDPADIYSAARFRKDALREMAQITAKGKVPLLVGGTMLYFRALTQGLSSLPPANRSLRARIDALAAVHGWSAMHERLRQVDPGAAMRIHPNDARRLQRALEVFELGQRPMTELCARPRSQLLQYNIVRLVLFPSSRQRLHERIARRFDGMLASGLLEEVAVLHRRKDLHPGLPALRAVGYRQAWAHLSGEIDYHQMVAAAVTATRHLAKRQLTWLRREREVRTFEAEPQTLGEMTQAIESVLSKPGSYQC
jgi:tRNA dimethylallyltransferase